jgi:multidrug efflux system membrane fusion protein
MAAADVHAPDVHPPRPATQHALAGTPTPQKTESPPLTAPPTRDERPPSRWGRAITWIVVLALLGAGGYYGWKWLHRSNDRGTAAAAGRSGGGRLLPVVAAHSRTGDLPIYLDALGNVGAYNTVTLRTRVDGQLMQIHFKEGQLVHQGDLLFEIDHRPYEVQLTQAQGQVAKDEASLNNARQDLKRYEAAAEAISQQQIDAARAAVKSAEGTLKADQGAIDAAKLNLTYTRIVAPITGKIGLRGVDVGNMVHTSDVSGLGVITQLQPIAVTFNVPEDDLPRVQRAMAGGKLLGCEAFDRDDRTHIATGTLEALDNQIDPTTATVRLKAVFPNADNALYPNQFVNVHLRVDVLKNVVLVPDAAVQRSPTSNFVYVVTDNSPKDASGGASGRQGTAGRGTPAPGEARPEATTAHSDHGSAQTQGAPEQKPQYVEMRPITLGPTEGHLAVIEQGLTPGEVVVTDGVDKLEPGSAVFVSVARDSQATAGADATQPANAATRPVGGAGRVGPRRGGTNQSQAPAPSRSGEAALP